MGYARSGLQGIGISIPNPDINLHPIDTNIDSIFDPPIIPFVAPTTGSGLINPFTDTSTGNVTPLAGSIPPASVPAATGLSKTWLYAGLAAAALIIFGKK